MPYWTVALRSVFQNGWSEHSVGSVNQTRPPCVNQMGKTHSKPLAAWVRHAMCELALSVLHEFIQVSLGNQLHGQHQRTWFWPSHSGYNTPGGRYGVSFWGLDTVYQQTINLVIVGSFTMTTTGGCTEVAPVPVVPWGLSSPPYMVNPSLATGRHSSHLQPSTRSDQHQQVTKEPNQEAEAMQ
jgi:hypothetical protein